VKIHVEEKAAIYRIYKSDIADCKSQEMIASVVDAIERVASMKNNNLY
jgi:hypothetical protein